MHPIVAVHWVGVSWLHGVGVPVHAVCSVHWLDAAMHAVASRPVQLAPPVHESVVES